MTLCRFEKLSTRHRKALRAFYAAECSSPHPDTLPISGTTEEKIDALLRNSEYYTIVAYTQKGHRFVGIGSLSPHGDSGVLKLTFAMAQNFKTSAFGVQIARHLMQYGFKHLKASVIFTEVQTESLEAVVAQQLGMNAGAYTFVNGSGHIRYSLNAMCTL